MPCNVFLAGNSEVSLVLQCFTAELITYIVCECDAPEWRRAEQGRAQGRAAVTELDTACLSPGVAGG